MMNCNNALVSVVISSYQSAGTLPRAIGSVLAQDYPHLEVVVVDNGSTDNTDQLLQAYAAMDGRVRPVRLDQNRRPAGGRNAGIEHSNGEYIAFLDADDEWLPGKLARQVRILDHYPPVALVFTDGCNHYEETGEKALFSTFNRDYLDLLELEDLDGESGIYWLKGPVRQTLCIKNFINLSSVLVRRNLFQTYGNFNPERFGPEDTDLWVRFAKDNQFVYWQFPTVNRYYSKKSLSSVSEGWLTELLNYSKDCVANPHYSDLQPQVRQNLEKYFGLLIIYYGRGWSPAAAWRTCFDSFHYGFFPKLPMLAALSFAGPGGYEAGIRLKAFYKKHLRSAI